MASTSDQNETDALPSIKKLRISDEDQEFRKLANVFAALQVYKPFQAYLDLPDVSFLLPNFDIEEHKDNN